MPSLGLEQRTQAAHSESKATDILQYLNELMTEQVIHLSVNFLSVLICKLGRMMTDRRWELKHDQE